MGKTYRIIFLASLYAFTGLMLLGCGGNSAKNVDINELADSLVNDITYENALSKEETLIDIVENAECVYYSGEYMKAEEVFVCKTEDKDAASVMEQNVKAFLENQMDAVEAYEPEAAARIKNAVLVKSGNYVILCVSDNPDKAREIINNAFK